MTQSETNVVPTDESGNEIQANSGQEIVEKPSGPKSLMDLIAAKKGAMAAVATKHLTPEKLVKIVGVQMSRVPRLAECTPMSILTSLMTCAELGLAPSTLGTAYLVPYRNGRTGRYECQLIVGYRGLVELARRSGTISTIQAAAVREGDEWEFELGLNAKLRHVPKADRGKPIVRVWAMVQFKDGAHQVAVMDRAEIEEIRRASKAGNNGPWVSNFEEMAKKTVIRRLCKLLPLTPEIEQQIAVVDRTEFDFNELAGDAPRESEEAEAPSQQETSEALAARIKGAAAKETPQPVAAETPIEKPAATSSADGQAFLDSMGTGEKPETKPRSGRKL